MRIALDVMGGDYSPKEQILAAVSWQQTHPEDVLLLVGDEEAIRAELSQHETAPERIQVVPASDVITMNEHPALALRTKKNASILVATGLVKQGLADAVVSSGNTGGQMVAGILGLGRLKGVERPPMLAELPGKTPRAFLDVGANVDCSAKQLMQFALLGCAYMKAIRGVEDPRVALLSNGAEEKKGNALVQETYQLMKEQTSFRFVGSAEGRDLLADDCPEVVVCDGFDGNLVLKTIEGTAMFMAKHCSRQYGSLPEITKELDYNQRGGVPLLGIQGISIVCHGSSKQQAIEKGLEVAKNCAENRLVALQRQFLEALQ